MNDAQVATVCAYVVSNWSNATITPGTLDVYRMELAPLDFDMTIATLREDFADSDFAPPPMKLRSAVLRRAQGSITYEQAMAELLDKIASVGYMSPEPLWSHHLIYEIVRLRGGWVEVCKSTPARAAVDAHGLSAFNTWSAQFRDEFKILAARSEHDSVHAALSGGRFGELDA